MNAKVLITDYRDGRKPMPIRVYMEKDFSQAERDLQLMKTFGDESRNWFLEDAEVYGTE
ncbi:hypothetical protein U5907_02410 [Bacteroidales bacterium MB20-C3-3]|nr:hypothetical protein U5907_02410 [Bacteroidales bacterium MB20-C3-3]